MKIVFCFCGKTFKGLTLDAIQDYSKRIAKYVPVEIIESKKLRPQRRDGIHIVLSPDGLSMDSYAFADFMEDQLLSGTRYLFFYVGGPQGLDEEILECAYMSLSLSRMTFNHQLIRVMLLEQVYRVFTIINNEPYHK